MLERDISDRGGNEHHEYITARYWRGDDGWDLGHYFEESDAREAFKDYLDRVNRGR